ARSAVDSAAPGGVVYSASAQVAAAVAASAPRPYATGRGGERRSVRGVLTLSGTRSGGFAVGTSYSYTAGLGLGGHRDPRHPAGAGRNESGVAARQSCAHVTGGSASSSPMRSHS